MGQGASLIKRLCNESRSAISYGATIDAGTLSSGKSFFKNIKTKVQGMSNCVTVAKSEFDAYVDLITRIPVFEGVCWRAMGFAEE